MLLGFKQRFVEPIILGTKIHTLRDDIGGRWRENKTIHMATGVRTKQYHCFKEDVCKSVQFCFIDFNNNGLIVKDTYSKTAIHAMNYAENIGMGISNNYDVTSKQLDTFAVNDGFQNWDDLKAFFLTGNPETQYYGAVIKKIIHWTNFKY